MNRSGRAIGIVGLISFLSSLPVAARAQAIRLGDLTAGGDGLGTAPPVNTGVDPRTGRFTTGYLDGPLALGDAVDDGLNPSPVPDSPYVDSVFFIAPGLPGSGSASQAITLSGVRFDFLRSDGVGGGWNYILRDRNGGLSSPGVQVGGVAIPHGSAVGIHASMGITYDLDALRARHGADRIGCFTAYWGLDGCDTGDANLYAVLSSEAGVIAGGSRTFRALGNAGEWVTLEIPAAARYLTLATGTNNGGTCAHGTFGDAKITCSPCPVPSFTALEAVEPGSISTRGGDEVTFTGRDLSPGYLYLLGGHPVTGVVPVDASMTRVRGIAPVLPAGRHDARVAFPAGGIAACLADAVEAVDDGPPAGEGCGGVLPAVADATLSSAAPAVNFGSGPLEVAQDTRGERRALLAFDLASIPRGSTVHRARLDLTVLEAAPAPSLTLRVHAVALNPQPFPPGGGPWSEAEVTWGSQPAPAVEVASLTGVRPAGTVSFDVTALAIHALGSAPAAGAGASLSLAVLAGSTGGATFRERLSAAGGPDPEGPRLVVECAPAITAAPVDPSDGDLIQAADLDRLRAASREPVSLRLEKGAVRFGTFDIAAPAELGLDGQAEWLLDEYRGLLGRSGDLDRWQLVRRSPDRRTLVFRQLHRGIPVFPAELAVHLAEGKVIGLGGNYVPEITLPAAPRLPAAEAERLALLGRSVGGAGTGTAGAAPARVVGDTQLRYVDLGLLGMADRGTRLAWQVNVLSGGGQVGLFIDAGSGEVIFEEARSSEAYDLYLKDRVGHPQIDWTLCWAPGAVLTHDENGPVVSNPPAEATAAFGGINATYAYWKTRLGRDSWDNAGVRIELFVNVVFDSPNANYLQHCRVMQFHPGWAKLDVIAHEFTHGMVHHTSDLVYATQSGALNESFSDIFGVYVDPADWLMGEDLSGGALRSLSNPPAGGQPDHVLAGTSGDGVGLRTLQNWQSPICDAKNVNYNDCGFVHTNSGIQNKAAYLITVGGVHNGRSIAGLGQVKAEQLFYGVMAGLTKNAQLIDARDLAVWLAGKKYGPFSTERCTVQNAYAAVGLGVGDADCDGTPDSQEGDQDGDQVPNGSDNCPFNANTGQADLDKDKIGDACDPDPDGDGIPSRDENGNKKDNCPFIANDQKDWDGDKVGDRCDDSDQDGILDYWDNCDTVPNVDQQNSDTDSLGDACDPDDDDDGKPDGQDNCPQRRNNGQEDSDVDGIGDACDLCPGLSDPDNGDPDRDGLGNPCDDDDDGDKLPDGSDNCPLVYNPDQAEGDGDNLGSACDGDEILGSIFHLDIQLLDPIFDLTDIPLPIGLLATDGSLPDGFTSTVHVDAPVGVLARVVDSEGIMVAGAAEAATSFSLSFEPAPHAAGATDGLGGGGGAAAASRLRQPPAPGEVRYHLQLVPIEPVDPGRSYRIAVEIEEGLPADLLRGDANDDGAVDISDALAIFGYLFMGTATPRCLDAADGNDDGKIDIADGIKVLGFLFLGDMLPHPTADPTPDELTCEPGGQ